MGAAIFDKHKRKKCKNIYPNHNSIETMKDTIELREKLNALYFRKFRESAGRFVKISSAKTINLLLLISENGTSR